MTILLNLTHITKRVEVEPPERTLSLVLPPAENGTILG
jgi:hypothetical protein